MGQPSFIEIALLNTEVSHSSKTKTYQGVPRTSASSPYPTPSVFILGGSGKKTLSMWVSGLSGELFLGYRASWEVMRANCMKGDKPCDLLSHSLLRALRHYTEATFAGHLLGGRGGEGWGQEVTAPLLWTKQCHGIACLTLTVSGSLYYKDLQRKNRAMLE